MPGINVVPGRSIVLVPAGAAMFGPTAAILSPSTRTDQPSCGWRFTPSNTRAGRRRNVSATAGTAETNATSSARAVLRVTKVTRFGAILCDLSGPCRATIELGLRTASMRPVEHRTGQVGKGRFQRGRRYAASKQGKAPAEREEGGRGLSCPTWWLGGEITLMTAIRSR